MADSTDLEPQESGSQRAQPLEHDLLSFTSLLIRKFNRYNHGITLLGVLLNDFGPTIPSASASGSYFRVTVVTSGSLFTSRRFANGFDKNPDVITPLVAVKVPIITDGVDSPRSKRLWTSMAKELQILKSDHLERHENIVTLFGIAWQTVANSNNFMPVFVLEASELGDLETYMSKTPLTLRGALGLSIDVAAGVQALHEVGIVHADLKPQNILIFKHPERGAIAKVADFGSSLIIDAIVGDQIQLEAGTSRWQAPECRQPIPKAELVKIDIYSLGVIVANLITHNRVAELLANVEEQNSTGDGIREVIVFGVRLIIEGEFNQRPRDRDETTDEGEDEDEADAAGIVGAVLIADVLSQPSERPSDAQGVHKRLRVLLSLILRGYLMRGDNIDMNSQEQDAYIQPELGEPSSDDLERVWMFAKMQEILRLIQEDVQNIYNDNRDISQAQVSRHIQPTLNRWLELDRPKPKKERKIVESGSILEADRCFGTLRIIPPVVFQQIRDQLEQVARSPTANAVRRQKAAFQHAVMVLSTIQLCPDHFGLEAGSSRQHPCVKTDCLVAITNALEVLYLGSDLGHKEARNVTIWLFETFKCNPPSDHDARKTISWLESAVLAASETACRHLKTISQDSFDSARQRLRTHYAGIGVDVAKFWQFADDGNFDEGLLHMRYTVHTQQPGAVETMYQCASHTGRVDLMTSILNIPGTTVDFESAYGETPLLWACRAGHTELTRLLLEKGADPTKTSAEAVTPLHFLSSFKEEDIPFIAELLVRSGASLEARSTDANQYHSLVDSIYGDVNGTPLTFAVAANNLVAVIALISLGADPFDKASRTAPVDGRWSTAYQWTPVLYASMYHKSQILEILLSPRGAHSESEVIAELNSGARPVGPWGETDNSTPLVWCVRYSTPGSLKRFLLHGKNFETAFRQTFEVLTSRGADPLVTSASDNISTLMKAAVPCGQPFVVRYLMDWQQGCLRPDVKGWLIFLRTALLFEDSATCDILLEYANEYDAPPSDWMLFFAAISEIPMNPELLQRFARYLDPNQDYGSIFAEALLQGHFTTAKWLYDNATCSFPLSTDEAISNDAQPSDMTYLGTLLVRSKRYDYAVAALKELFALPDPPPETFNNVAILGGSAFNALHLAAFYPEYNTGSEMKSSVMELVLEKYYEPEHLNAKIPQGRWAGCTPLHIAVSTCNTEAVKLLLDEDDIAVNETDSKGLTPMDFALRNFKNQWDDMASWDVPSEDRTAADMQHFLRSVKVYSSMRSAKAKSRRFIAAVVRTEPDDLMVLPSSDDEPVLHIPFMQKPLPEMLQGVPFFVAASKLEVDHCFIVARAVVEGGEKDGELLTTEEFSLAEALGALSVGE